MDKMKIIGFMGGKYRAGEVAGVLAWLEMAESTTFSAMLKNMREGEVKKMSSNACPTDRKGIPLDYGYMNAERERSIGAIQTFDTLDNIKNVISNITNVK